MIKKLAIPLTLAIAATLSACAGSGGTQVTTRVIAPVDQYYVASAGWVPYGGEMVRSGNGKVTHLTDLQGPVANTSYQRAVVKMNDGSTQALGVQGVQLTMNEEIRIRTDSNIGREATREQDFRFNRR
jgi:hypothetical protein